MEGRVTVPYSVLFSLSLLSLVLLVDATTVVATESLQVGPSHPASHKQEPLIVEQLPCSEQSHLATSTQTAHHTPTFNTEYPLVFAVLSKVASLALCKGETEHNTMNKGQKPHQSQLQQHIHKHRPLVVNYHASIDVGPSSTANLL